MKTWKSRGSQNIGIGVLKRSKRDMSRLILNDLIKAKHEERLVENFF